MKILCAESLTHGEAAFSELGEVTLAKDALIDANMARGFDALAVRSKTRVDDSFFATGSRLRFVGTATAGTDHFQVAHVPEQVRLESAAGCNANSVAEYVVAALLELAYEEGVELEGLTLGIIGHGHVGQLVEQRVQALGMRCLLNDPPREAAGLKGDYRTLPDVLTNSDVITLHVPLVEDGPWPTRRLLNDSAIHRMRRGTWLINACRGEVIENDSLIAACTEGHLGPVVLDVWDPEPEWPLTLDAVSRLGTPHIAGHSWEGKWNGTRMLVSALAESAGLEDPGERLDARFRPEKRIIRPRQTSVGLQNILRDLIRQTYDIRADHLQMQKGRSGSNAERGQWFSALRADYPMRPEFRNVAVSGVDEATLLVLQLLGFSVD